MMQTLKTPSLWIWLASLAIYTVLVNYILPGGWQRSVPLINTFVILTVLFRSGNRLHGQSSVNSERIERKLDDVIEMVNNSTKARAKEFIEAKHRIAEVARQVEIETERRQAEAAKALQDQTDALAAKIDESTAASRESTAASRDAHDAANNFNQKIVDLSQRLVDAAPPRTQVDEIQATGQESHDMLDAMVEKKSGHD